jgi:methylglutaconyl-CoA hydratase
VRVGIAPAVISTYVVPKIGLSAARRFMVTGERFGAETARQIGLVHEVASPEDLDGAVEAVVAQICSAWAGAQRTTKMLLSNVWATEEREAYVAAAIEAGVAARMSEEGRQGIAEFLARSRDHAK